MMKKLYRSQTNKSLYGVLGGLGEYYDQDPTVLRLAFIVILVCTGLFPFALIYLLAVLVIPENPNKTIDETVVIINKEDK
jgi:phage shock protein C